MMKVVQLQTKVWKEKERNLEELKKNMEKIGKSGADLVALGEMFNCPYSNDAFGEYAEPQGGHSWQVCSDLAKQYGIWLSAGTMPEIDEQGNLYNTAYVFDRNGKQAAKHRKMHLFDVDIKGGQYYKESEVLKAGDFVTVFDTEFGKMGIAICFDLRFPELARLMVDRGAKLLLFPAAFNMTSGPKHWQLLYRCRAVDNQCFLLGTSPAREESAGYVAWGHSLSVSPWGEILGELDEKEGMLITELDLSEADRVREELPLLSARRKDIYRLEEI